uniref:Uncharacterized protein n=1 Tax=Cacopsylla melanoneura TaxID=428564 RepID=A0A8D8UN32_9HEMI
MHDHPVDRYYIIKTLLIHFKKRREKQRYKIQLENLLPMKEETTEVFALTAVSNRSVCNSNLISTRWGLSTPHNYASVYQSLGTCSKTLTYIVGTQILILNQSI